MEEIYLKRYFVNKCLVTSADAVVPRDEQSLPCRKGAP